MQGNNDDTSITGDDLTRREQEPEEEEPATAITDEQLYAVVILLRGGFSLRAVTRLLEGVYYTTLWRRLQKVREDEAAAARHHELERLMDDMKRRPWRKLERRQHQLMLMLEVRSQLWERAGETLQLDPHDPRLQGCCELVQYLQLQVQQLQLAIQPEMQQGGTRQVDAGQGER